MTRFWHGCASILLLVTSLSCSRTQTSWTDKIVLPKKSGITINNNEKGILVPLATPSDLDYRGNAEEADKIKVRTGKGMEGWFEKGDVVLFEQAIDYFTDRLNNSGDDADAYTRRGWTWQMKNELDNAIKDFDEAVRLDPRPHAFLNRSVAHGRKGDHDRALADLNEVLRLDPKNVEAYNNRGLTWEGKKDDEKAIADFSEAIRLDPKFSIAYLNRGNAFARKKDFDKALADFNEVIRINPD